MALRNSYTYASDCMSITVAAILHSALSFVSGGAHNAEYALGRFGIGLGRSARRSSRSGVTARWAYGDNGAMARRPGPPGGRDLVLARPVPDLAARPHPVVMCSSMM